MTKYKPETSNRPEVIGNSRWDSLKQLAQVTHSDAAFGQTFREAAGQRGGWANDVTGLGIHGRDKRMNMTAFWAAVVENEVEELYAIDDIAGKVIDTPPDLGTRKWIETKVGDEDGGKDMKKSIDDEFERLKVKEKFNLAWKWARLYGGAGIFISVDDGKELSEPLNMDSLRRVKNLTVLSRYELWHQFIDYDLDSDNFMKPEFYYLNPRSGALSAQTTQVVHHSRIIRFDGVVLPRRLHIRNNYWGDSNLNRMFNVLRNFNMAHDSMATVTQDFRLGILKIKNLADIVSSGDANLLKDRVELMNLCKSVLGSIMLDAEDEDYTNLATSLNGVEVLLDKINNRLVAATEMPHTLVLGEGASGFLSGAGESEARMLNDYVHGQQELKLEKPINRAAELIQNQIQGPTQGFELESFAWDFNALISESEMEEINKRSAQANVDKTYWDIGALSAEEIRQSRFGGDEYTNETTIENDEDLTRVDADDHAHSIGMDGFTGPAVSGDGETSAVGDPNHVHELPNGKLTGAAVELPDGSHYHPIEGSKYGASGMYSLKTVAEIEAAIMGE